MNSLKIEIVRLEPMLVASTYGYGKNPEDEAWKKMAAWAGPLGFFENLKDNPIYGYNNPPPLNCSKEYGYELSIKVDRDCIGSRNLCNSFHYHKFGWALSRLYSAGNKNIKRE